MLQTSWQNCEAALTLLNGDRSSRLEAEISIVRFLLIRPQTQEKARNHLTSRSMKTRVAARKPLDASLRAGVLRDAVSSVQVGRKTMRAPAAFVEGYR